jgi:hypothetical protein
MNPELQRNLWLEATPFRLVLILGLLLLVFSATSVAPEGGDHARCGAGAVLVLRGAVVRARPLSVVAEIRERTWDGQKLSPSVLGHGVGQAVRRHRQPTGSALCCACSF